MGTMKNENLKAGAGQAAVNAIGVPKTPHSALRIPHSL